MTAALELANRLHTEGLPIPAGEVARRHLDRGIFITTPAGIYFGLLWKVAHFSGNNVYLTVEREGAHAEVTIRDPGQIVWVER